ncbi:alpha/beta fold hydrolase [Novosphingobium terrae]|uniref:alpha/beta fold hydrolase n=1 Tax=Novosphingobium terrae TaxID=2726189 RepID=UPI00197EB90F|nr:alpha/beta fold hydrolase [Novosphingobium terrae]
MSAVFKSEGARRQVLERYRALLASWPIDHAQHLLPTRQGETFVLACGPEQAPPLILLHGMQANAASWLPDAALWSQKFRVYALDLIGQPGLSAPSQPPFTGDAYTLWLDDVLNGLGLKQAAVVGVSLGGWIALDYAIRRPDRVTSLALLCPTGIGRQRKFLLKALPLMLLGPWGMRRIRAMVIGPERAGLEPLAQAIVDLMRLIGQSARLQALHPPVFQDDALAGLRMPLLAILGGRDVLLDSRESRERLERLLPEAQIRFLPEARHFIPGQAETILQFLLA